MYRKLIAKKYRKLAKICSRPVNTHEFMKIFLKQFIIGTHQYAKPISAEDRRIVNSIFCRIKELQKK